MKKLEEVASAEKKRIEQAEKFLEEDAALFDEFLKENDSNSVQAVKLFVKFTFINLIKTEHFNL